MRMSEGLESREATGPGRGIAPGLLLTGLIVLATALRVWRLGQWGFAGDEIFTLVDSIQPRLSNPRPLLYFLNYYLVRPVTPLDELGLRLLPAFFGVLGVAALYLIGRRLVGSRAAFFGALLLAVSPLHVYQSQYARYWSLVFLLSAVYPYAIYFGIREHNGRWLGFGLVLGVLAVLAHPVAVLPLGGLALFLALQLRRDDVARLWSRKPLRWAASLIGGLALIAAVRSISILQGWIASHDAKTRLPDLLLPMPRPPVVKQMGILLAYMEGLTLPVALIGAVGIYLLWQGRSRSLGFLLTCLFVFPVICILLLSFRTAVSMTYLLPTAPVLFIGAGVFLDRVAEIASGVYPRWLLPATVTAIVIAAGAPILISDYRDGRRFDFRGAAEWLEPRLVPGESVFSDQFRVMRHYLQSTPVEHLAADTASIMQSVRVLRASGRGGALWIVAPAPSHAFRTNLKRGGLISWIYQNCQLRNTVGVGRVDFRQDYLQIYRCQPPVSPDVSRPATVPNSSRR